MLLVIFVDAIVYIYIYDFIIHGKKNWYIIRGPHWQNFLVSPLVPSTLKVSLRLTCVVISMRHILTLLLSLLFMVKFSAQNMHQIWTFCYHSLFITNCWDVVKGTYLQIPMEVPMS